MGGRMNVSVDFNTTTVGLYSEVLQPVTPMYISPSLDPSTTHALMVTFWDGNGIPGAGVNIDKVGVDPAPPSAFPPSPQPLCMRVLFLWTDMCSRCICLQSISGQPNIVFVANANSDIDSNSHYRRAILQAVPTHRKRRKQHTRRVRILSTFHFLRSLRTVCSMSLKRFGHHLIPILIFLPELRINISARS